MERGRSGFREGRWRGWSRRPAVGACGLRISSGPGDPARARGDPEGATGRLGPEGEMWRGFLGRVPVRNKGNRFRSMVSTTAGSSPNALAAPERRVLKLPRRNRSEDPGRGRLQHRASSSRPGPERRAAFAIGRRLSDARTRTSSSSETDSPAPVRAGGGALGAEARPSRAGG